jgi:hypothetical protein
MSNINSNGKFGTSMDYSQLLEIRRKYINTNSMRIKNPSNTPTIKPFFNQDKFVREGRTNGAVDFYFTRGLYSVYSRVGTGK